MNRSLRNIGWLGIVLWLLLGCVHKPQETVDALPYCEEDTTAWGLLTTDGTVAAPSGTWGQAPSAVVNGRFTATDTDGRVHLYGLEQPDRPLSHTGGYYRIGYFFDRVTVAQHSPDMPFVLLDRDGETVAVVDNSVRMMHNFSCARALVYTDTGHYGYMDLQGRLVLPAVYDYAADFADGVALVGRLDADGRMGYAFIDENGEVATLPGTSSRLLGVRYSDGLLNCRELDSGRCVYMDRKGRDALFLSDTIVESFPFRDGRAVVQSEQGRGVIDRQGRSVVASVYTDIYLSGKDRMALCRAGQWQLADAEGNPLSPARYEAVSPFLPSDALVVRKAGRMALLNADGHTAAVGWVDSIACDPVALRLIPQVFVRSEKATSHAADKVMEKDSVKKADEPLKPEREVPVRVTHRTAPDWRTVGKDNPFYAEAVKVVSGRLEEDDAERRRIILNYVEHLRTAYTTKDVDFLEQLFSERALIVVGTVIRASSQESEGYLSPRQVVYNIKSKQEYLGRLKELFRTNKHIDLQFSGFKIMRHPTAEGIYGVSLRQAYRSDLYSDDGYLFLLWDFRNPAMPQIHVRTWQPAFPDGHTPLPEDEILDIRNFNLQ